MIRLKDVVDAMEMVGDDVFAYANRSTGEVRLVSHEHRLQAESGADTSDFPEWERAAVTEAREVLESGDWLSLPTKFAIHEWAIMEEFARSLPDEAHRTELLDAIHGSGAFRRFKTAVRGLGIERRWSAHRAEAFERIARSWLEEHALDYR